MRLPPAADLLSIVRVPGSLALLLVFEPHSQTRMALSGVLIGLLIASDLADGRLARRQATASRRGYVLDGWSDRAFHVAVYLLFFAERLLHISIVWILIFREITVYAVRSLDPHWHTDQRLVERYVNVAYSIVIRTLCVAEVLRVLVDPPVSLATVRLFYNVLMGCMAVLSYRMLLPRLAASWAKAVDA